VRRVSIGFVMLGLLLTAVPASAKDETIEILVEGVVRGQEGEVIEVASVPVAAHLIGARCTAGSVTIADDGSSHPNNDFIVETGDTMEEILDYERVPGAVVPMTGALTLGDVIKVSVRLGPNRVTSGGFLISLNCTPPGRGRFVDDDNSVFEGDIEWLAQQNITRGCNPPKNDRFCPNDFVTRGQMAAFMVRALHLTDSLDNPFVDDDTSVFEADIEKIAAAGITKGCNPPANDRYCPTNFVTRGQMAAFLVRALKYTDDGGGDLFVDDDDSIFESDIDKLGTAGVTKGCNPPVNDQFCPDDFVTRGQMAAFLHRALG
jgi:hypothetical protein